MIPMETATLITAAELAAAIEGPRPPALLDVRWQLGGPPGAEDYAVGHIPGAHFVDMNTDLAAPAGPKGRHPLPDPAVFGAALRRAGVDADREVVVYDAATSASAARAWWLLRWAGHRRVRVLDGGLAAWTAAGLPLEQQAPAAGQGDFVPAPGALPTLDADAAAALARSRTAAGRPGGGALPGRGRADRPEGRPHPGRGQRPDHGQPPPGRTLPARPGNSPSASPRWARSPVRAASASTAARG